MPSPSTAPLHMASLPTGNLISLPETSTGGCLAKIAPFTSEVVARMHVIEALAKRAAQKRSSSTEGARVTANDGSHDWERCAFKVTQAQLDDLRALLCILAGISMRVLAYDKLFHNTKEDMNEIFFPVAAFKCGVRLPLAPLLGQCLSEMPFHPL